jgi:hypothetical protein
MKTASLLLLSLFCVLPARAADGTSAAPGAERRAQMEKRCAENPERCQAMKAQMEQRRVQCQADPEKCRQERRATLEKHCQENPERCQAMKAQMEQRRAQCQADPEKCRQQHQARAAERFKQADADGSGTLSKAEAEKGMPGLARRFDAIDGNKDGQISREEIEAARKARAGGKAGERRPGAA